MKSPLTVAFTIYCKLPEHTQDFGKLCITILPVIELADSGSYPVRVFNSHWNKEEIEISFQSNYEDPRRWYAGSLSYNCERIAADAFTLMPWFKRRFNDRHGYKDPRDILTVLSRHSRQVWYSSVFNHYIEAKHFDAVKELRCFYDTNVPGHTSGCTINAYAPAGSSPETIRAAVEKALRESRHCSGAEFAGWVANGSTWKAAHHDKLPVRPPSMEDVCAPLEVMPASSSSAAASAA